MSEGGSHDGSTRKRKMLGDITISHAKWGFPLGQGKFIIGKETSRQKENVDHRIEDVNFGQLVYEGLAGSTKQKETFSGVLTDSKTFEGDTRKRLSVIDDGLENGMSFISPSLTCKSIVLGSNGEPTQFSGNLDTLHANSKMKELSTSSKCGVALMEFNATSHGTTKAEWLFDGRTSGVSCPVQSAKAKNSSPVVEKDCQENFGMACGDVKDIQTEAIAGDKHEIELHSFSTLTHRNLEFENLKKNKLNDIGSFMHEPLHESCTEGSSRPSSSKMLSFGELETTHSPIREHVANVEDSLTSSSACSCSFCLKAAYIFTDLLYQDVRGRLAELKKRTKEARILGGKQYSINSAENSNNFSRLEFDFLHHWRPVFRKTENILAQEIDQLKSSLRKLEELREKCKTDVEIVSRVH